MSTNEKTQPTAPAPAPAPPPPHPEITPTPGTFHVPVRIVVRNGCPHVLHAETGEPVVIGGKMHASGWLLRQGRDGFYVECRIENPQLEFDGQPPSPPAPFTGTPPEALAAG